MKSRDTITIGKFYDRLAYDPETGVLIWKTIPEITRHDKSWNTRFAGNLAGSLNVGGYVVIRVFGRQWQAHRVGWAIHYGEWPKEELDHINGKTSDNRLVNLRPANNSENRQNIALHKNSTSGFTGVHHYRCRSWQRWRARIGVDGKRITLGFFDTPEKAHQAYLAAKAKLHRYDASGRVQCLG